MNMRDIYNFARFPHDFSAFFRINAENFYIHKSLASDPLALHWASKKSAGRGGKTWPRGMAGKEDYIRFVITITITITITVAHV
jgi:hypothetical protein